MNKVEHISWWKDEAQRTWETALYNQTGGMNLFALFLFHLTVEKLLKAVWVKHNIDNIPPRIRDLIYLYNQTDLTLENNWSDYLSVVSEWNIESRYPDYKLKNYERASAKYVEEHLRKLEILRDLLLNEL